MDIHEDYEFDYERDMAFLHEERKRREIAEWQQWEYDNMRLPAKIEVKIEKQETIET
jgi:uncharacterized protein YjaZ